MTDASFQVLVLAWLTVLTLPWVVLLIWASCGGPGRAVAGVLRSIEPCATCGGLGFFFESGQQLVTCPDCEGSGRPPRGRAGPPPGS